MARRSQLVGLTLSGTILCLVAGCARSAADHPTIPGAVAGEPEPDRLAALEAELEQDEQRLYASVRRLSEPGTRAPLAPAPPMQPGATAPASGPPLAPPVEPSESASTPDDAAVVQAARAPAKPTSESQRTSSLPPCEEACRAFASMQRAAQSICRLTGDAEPRCVRARDRVARAEERLTAGGCGCSAE